MQASYGRRMTVSPPCSREGYWRPVSWVSRRHSSARPTPLFMGTTLGSRMRRAFSRSILTSSHEPVAAGLPAAPKPLALGATGDMASGPDVRDRAHASFMKEVFSGRLMNFRNRTSARARNLVWRIAEDAPLGAWLDSTSAPTAARAERPDAALDNWAGSSFDLLHGADVREISFAATSKLLDETRPLATIRRKPPGGSA